MRPSNKPFEEHELRECVRQARALREAQRCIRVMDEARAILRRVHARTGCLDQPARERRHRLEHEVTAGTGVRHSARALGVHEGGRWR